MKRLICLSAILMIAGKSMAQSDSTKKNSDTVVVGNFIIIKKNNGNSTTENNRSNRNNYYDFHVERRSRKNSNVRTNWFIFDLGFANYRDHTNYPYAQAGSYFKTLRPADGQVTENSYRLNTGKSSNVNIWLFMQRLNVSKHVLNLKYGFGLEMYNFRYDTRLSTRKDPAPYVFNDSIGFSKNKLYVSYLTIPFMLNINPSPDNYKSFNFSAGISAGYLVESYNKQISNERGKIHEKGDFNFEPWRVALVGEMGLGPIRLYGSYSLNRLQKEITRVEQYPYVIGIRFSSW